MKYVLMGVIILLAMFPVIERHTEMQAFEHEYEQLKVTSDLAAQAAGLFTDRDRYANGEIIFNQTEGIKACEAIITSHLELNEDLTPKETSYYQEQVDYTIVFLDDDEIGSFPVLYTDPESGYTKTMGSPGVIVVIDGGEPRFNDANRRALITCRRLGAYVYEERR